jgi:hypothetical protein
MERRLAAQDSDLEDRLGLALLAISNQLPGWHIETITTNNSNCLGHAESRTNPALRRFVGCMPIPTGSTLVAEDRRSNVCLYIIQALFQDRQPQYILIRLAMLRPRNWGPTLLAKVKIESGTVMTRS